LNSPLEGKALLDDLVLKFPPCQIEGHGSVLKIPGLKWEPDWEGLLPDENECVTYMEHNETYVLVKLHETPQQAAPQVSEDPPKESDGWKSPEEALLVKLWKKGDKVKEICKELLKVNPKRTEKAVTSKIVYLERKGIINKRYRERKKKPEPKPQMQKSFEELQAWLIKRQKQLFIEPGPVAIRIGKYDMIRETLEQLAASVSRD
jgi:hypothetical protein